MRTSLNEIKLIDGYLFNKNTPEEALLFDALLILNPDLPANVAWQKRTVATVQQYGRKQLKAEIEAVHKHMFNDREHRGFKERILSFFS